MVLVEVMLNRLHTIPVLELDAAALYQVMLCFRQLIKTDGVQNLTVARGAIDAMCLCLDFAHSALAIQVLELLSVVTVYGGPDALWQAKQGIKNVAQQRGERPYGVFAAAMITGSIEVQVAVVSFINTLIMSEKEIDARVTIRSHLTAVHFNRAVEFLVDFDENMSATGFTSTVQAAMLEDLERDLLTDSSGAVDSRKNRSNRSVLIAYEKRYGRSGYLSEKYCEGIAEDGKTKIHPAAGIMAGYAKEAKKSKEGIKVRFYYLVENEFKWYHKEKWANGEPENGKISMANVIDIVEYSTSENLQNVAKFDFVIEMNKADGRRFQIGVDDEATKQKWILALRTAQNAAMVPRFGFQMQTKALNKAEREVYEKSLLKHVILLTILLFILLSD
jgi:hypothetical protein